MEALIVSKESGELSQMEQENTLNDNSYGWGESKVSEVLPDIKMIDMNNMNLSLTKTDTEHVNNMSKLAYDDTNLEFETRVTSTINSDEFKNVREFCRQKTCTNNWKCIKDREKTLDITIDTVYRVTINGIHYIVEYLKSNSLDNLPENSWSIMKKKTHPQYEDVTGTRPNGHPIDYLDIKLNLKEEIYIDKSNEIVVRILENWAGKKKKFRLKNRYSYLIDDAYCIDLTVVKNGHYTGNLIRTKEEEYEIEVEYVPNIIPTQKKEFDLQKWNQIMYNLLCTLDTTKKTLTSISELINTEKEYYSLISKNKIQYYSGNKYHEEFRKRYSLNPNVVTLTFNKLKNLIEDKDEYYVTPKSDGLRMSGYIDKNGKLFLFGQHSKNFQFSGVVFKEDCKNSIFDGELITKTKQNKEIYDYLIFDCYYNNGNDIRDKELQVRRSICNRLIDKANIVKQDKLLNDVTCRVILKEFIDFKTGEFHEKCKKCFNSIDNSEYENDGLIFTPTDSVGGDKLYKNDNPNKFIKSGITFDRLFKWKDSKFNSIDFRIQFGSTIEIPILENRDYILQKFKNCSLYVQCPDDKRPVYTRKNFIQDIKKSDNKNDDINDIEKEFQPIEPFDDNASYVSLPIIDNKVCCKVNDRWEGDTIEDNDIVEMIYDVEAPSDNKWIPIRIRKDKSYPNFIDVALDVWKSIHLPITESMLTGREDIPYIDSIDQTNPKLPGKYYNNAINRTESPLRIFHRVVVKGMLFANSIGLVKNKSNKPPRLLDIGSGKGGDINRYIEHNADVIGVDNSMDNLHNRRDGAYKRMSLIYKNNIKRGMNLANDKIIFIAGDGGNLFTNSNTFINNGDDYYKKFVEKHRIFEKRHSFDTVSVFFAIHYFFKSKTTFNNFIQNIAYNVKQDGYFVGCCYDGEIVHKQLVENNDNPLSFRTANGDLILEIEKNYDGVFDDTEKSLGKEINVNVQSINMKHPEYLVNFRFLSKELFKLGFVMEETKNFEYYYNADHSNSIKYPLDPEEKKASFLNRTFIFKRISYKPQEIYLN